jgi:uncharacterized membrane protein
MIAFITGPLWGLQLDYPKNQHVQLIQIAIPTFLSYLTAAVAYATTGRQFAEPGGERGKILRVVSFAGLLIFMMGFIAATSMYYFSANGMLTFGQMQFEQYSNIVTLLIGILSVTTTAVSAFIYSTQPESSKDAPSVENNI